MKKKKLSAYLVPVIRQSVPVIRQSLNALTHSSLYKYTVKPSFSVVTDLAALGYNIGSQTVDFAKKHPIFTAFVVGGVTYLAYSKMHSDAVIKNISQEDALKAFDELDLRDKIYSDPWIRADFYRFFKSLSQNDLDRAKQLIEAHAAKMAEKLQVKQQEAIDRVVSSAVEGLEQNR